MFIPKELPLLQNFGFINRVDKRWIAAVGDLESW